MFIYLLRQPDDVGEDRDSTTHSPRGGLIFIVVDRSLFHPSILVPIHSQTVAASIAHETISSVS